MSRRKSWWSMDWAPEPARTLPARRERVGGDFLVDFTPTPFSAAHEAEYRASRGKARVVGRLGS